MVGAAVLRDVPDPMHLPDNWEESDEPLASDYHNLEQIHCFSVLHEMFAGPKCYVSFQRWLRRDPLPRLQPDILIALDRPDVNRTEYDPRIEGKPPDLLAEWLSPSSFDIDMDAKLDAYAVIGVREYWVFNPAGRFAVPRIQGWTLRGESPATSLQPARNGSFTSQILLVRFRIDGDTLELLNPRTGKPLTPVQAAKSRLRQEFELRMAAEAALQRGYEERAQTEAAFRREIEARSRVEAEIRQAAEAALRQEIEARSRVEAEIRQTAEVALRQEIEARRRAEAEVQRLQAELERLRREHDGQ